MSDNAITTKWSHILVRRIGTASDLLGPICIETCSGAFTWRDYLHPDEAITLGSHLIATAQAIQEQTDDPFEEVIERKLKDLKFVEVFVPEGVTVDGR